MTQPTVLPFLMFQDAAGSAALDFYRSIFPDFEIHEMELHGPGETGPERSIKRARFSVGGQSILCTDSPIRHAFSFTPSFSLFVECRSEEQLRSLHDALGKDGAVLMPIGSYGFSKLFTWVTDRFDVSWQLNQA